MSNQRNNGGGHYPAKTTVKDVQAALVARQNVIADALPHHIKFDRFMAVVTTVLAREPDVCQKCTRDSILIACMDAARDGLMPDGREAKILPYWNNRERRFDAQYVPMVYGLRKKVMNSHEVSVLITGLVYPDDVFDPYIDDTGQHFTHRPNFFSERRTDADIVAAYSFAKMRDGEVHLEVMNRAEIERARQASPSGADGRSSRDGKALPPTGPWVDWYGEMARKSVLRRHTKSLPSSSDKETFRDVEAERFSVEMQQAAPALGSNVEAAAQERVAQQPARPAISAPATTMPPIDMEIPDFGDAAPVHTGHAMPEVDQRAERMPEPEPGMPVDEAEERLRNCETIIDLQTRWAQIESANEWSKEAYDHLNGVYAECERDLKRGR